MQPTESSHQTRSLSAVIRRCDLPAAAWLAVAVGFVFRLVYLVVAKRDQVLLINDSFYYSAQSVRLSEGRWFVDLANEPAAEHGPLSSVVFSIASWMPNPVNWQRLVNVFVGSAVVLLVAVVARRFGTRRTAACAGWIAALYPNLWISDVLIMSEPLACLMLLVVLLLAHRALARPSGGQWVGVGVAIGLAALTRSELVLLAPLLAAFVVQRWKPALIVCASAAMVIAPWSVFNTLRFDAPVLLTTNEGTTLLAANCPDTYYGDLIGGGSLACVLAEDATSIRDPAERSSRQREIAVSYAKDHAERLALVIAARIARTADVYAVRQMVINDRAEERGLTASWFGVFAWWLLAPCAALGIRRLTGRARRLMMLPLVCVGFVVVSVYGGHRVRGPLEPIVAIGAALFVAEHRWFARGAFAESVRSALRRVRSTTGVAIATVWASVGMHAAVTAAHGWRAAWDVGFVGGRAFDALGPRPWLLGMPSTASAVTGRATFHPGPWHGWLLAVPQQAFAWTPHALLFAQAILSALALTIVVLSGRELFGRQGALGGAALAVAFTASMGSATVADPWNPHAGAFMLLAAFAALAAASAKARRWTPVVVAMASVAAQTHVSFAAPAGAAIVASVVLLVWQRSPGAGHRWSIPTAAVLSVAWMPSLVHELRPGPGNVAALIDGASGDNTVGFRFSFNRLIAVLRPDGLIAGRRFTAEALVADANIAGVVGVGMVTVLAVIGARFWIRGGGTEARGGRVVVVAAVVVGMLAAFLATSRQPATLAGLFGGQLARVWWPLGAGFYLFALIPAGRLLQRSQQTRPTTVAPMVLTVAVAAGVVAAAWPGPGAYRDESWFGAIDDVAAAARDELDPGPVAIAAHGLDVESALVPGVWYELRRAGIDAVLVGPVAEGLVAPSFVVGVAPPSATVLHISVDGLQTPGRLVARFEIEAVHGEPPTSVTLTIEER